MPRGSSTCGRTLSFAPGPLFDNCPFALTSASGSLLWQSGFASWNPHTLSKASAFPINPIPTVVARGLGTIHKTCLTVLSKITGWVFFQIEGGEINRADIMCVLGSVCTNISLWSELCSVSSEYKQHSLTLKDSSNRFELNHQKPWPRPGTEICWGSISVGHNLTDTKNKSEAKKGVVRQKRGPI